MLLSYEDFKQKLRKVRHLAAYSAGLVAMLLLGIAIGRGEAPSKSTSPQINYNITSEKQADTAPPAVSQNPVPQTAAPAGATLGATSDCVVKGNISSASKIYHVQGGAFYDRTNAEMCFATESEAVAAGFRKSSR